MRVSEQDVQQASRQVDAARGEAVTATMEQSAALSEVFSRGLSKLRSTRNSSGSSTSSFEQMGDTLNQLDQITQSVAQSTGLSQAQVARIAFGAAAHVGVNAKVAGAELHTSTDKSYQSSLSAQEQKALASMSGEQLVAFKQFGDRVSRDASYLQALSNDASEAREMSSRLGSTRARSERADATLADRTSFAERVSSAHDKGESISIDIAQDPHNMEMFLRYAQTYGGNSAAAHALMSAELARQSLRPNRVISDGSSLPTSFGDIRNLHKEQLLDVASTPDINSVHRSHVSQASRFGSNPSRPLDQKTTLPSPMREEMQQHAAQIHGETAAKRGEFDSKAEIVRTDDGTLESRKSLVLQSMRQVKKDASGTADNAKDQVNDLLKSKK